MADERLTGRLSSVGTLRNSLSSESEMSARLGVPNVPSWALQPNKPSYTASEVGALPDSTAIPSKTSDLTNDSGFVNASGAASAAPVQSVNGQTGAVTVKTPYYLTVTIENDIPSVNKTPTEIEAMSAAGYDVHLKYTYNIGVPIQLDMGYGGNVIGYAVFYAFGEGMLFHALVASDKTFSANVTTIPQYTSDLSNDSGFITASDIPAETDPTVPAWAKASSKPTYTASEVGALPDTTKYADSASVAGAAKRTASIPFAKVDGTSTSTVYTASCPEITEFRDGVCLFLMNGVVTSESGFTLNVNNLGAKPVYSTLSAASRATTLFNINYTWLLVYNSRRVDGGCWDAYYGYDSNTNTLAYQVRTNNTTMPTTDKFYRYRLLFTSADGKHYVPANTSSSTNATATRTVNQRPIDPFGAIFYYGHTTAINANANPSTSYFWQQYNITLGYSFNRTGADLVLTNHAPVYIKCAPQADGSAIIDADNPYVQTLPSTADGKIYIFLGVASGETTVELFMTHPVYCYRNGAVRKWTGIEAELDALSARIGVLESL